MVSLRNAAVIALVAGVIYAVLPASRKARLAQKLRELARALVISIILFWILMLGRTWMAG